jgi:negative regulator of sigma E activity
MHTGFLSEHVKCRDCWEDWGLSRRVLKKSGEKCGLDFSAAGQRPLVVSCEHGSESWVP